ncbi:MULTISPECIES: MFS transporter [unclassified Novosphingobium]|uniref:MFS transporter n=1 Tax=unclassified Novosphingobium TaxID=2644732 RepID=UPI001469B031|nr:MULTISPECIES: MFS transporter [unclassified Novosphingobium]NMN05238.1 MFS family permease [Novosphingobium sp. SG919]NMN87533.1 MFS family permease [Novosphingobium sp. SG916]
MRQNRNPGVMTGIALLLPITLSTMAIVLLAPVLPGILAEFSGVPGHEYWVPMILTIPALCIALFSTLAGLLGDVFGRRRLLVASFVIYAIVGVAPVFLRDLGAILVSRIGVGIAEALIMVLSTTMIGDYFHGAARDKWLAAQTAFASVSALLFFNIGGQLGNFGWRTPFWVYLSALLMLALVLCFTWEPKDAAAQDGGAAAAGQAPARGWAGFPWARMLLILAITVYGAIFFYTVQIQASAGLAVLGVTNPARAGFLTSIASIGVPLGTFIYSRIGRWPVQRLLVIEFGFLAVGFLLMGRAETTGAFVVGCFINQLGAGLLLPTLLVWAMSLLAFEVRGRGAGMWQSAFALGQFLSPVVVTFAATHAGGLQNAFAVMSGGAVAGLVVLLLCASRIARVGDIDEAGLKVGVHG